MKKMLLTAVATLLAQGAFAEALPKVLEIPVKAGLQVVNRFQAAGNLQGFILSQAGQNSVVYTTPDGKFLLAGALIDEAGQNLTAQYAEKYIPKPEYEKLFSKLEKSQYLVEGAKGNAAKSTVYVFIDPNCMFCHYAWKALRPYEAAGLQVRWVPVGFLTKDSMGKAAALLEASNPEAAMLKHETEFNPQAETGGIAPINVSPAMQKKLEANNELMRSFGMNGTPGFVFKDASGKVLVRNGMPKLPDFAVITGLPEQKQTDADLQRFK